ncbi:hypothetical protein KBH77_00905 [Patescibacteria group bacterium]|nr:hypothetical protein [Patescibacteria group bacterium]
MIKKILPIIVITILVISFSSPTMAAQNNYNNLKNKAAVEDSLKKKSKKIIYSEIQKAIQDKDYNTWKKLLEENNTPQNKRLLAVINESNFKRYADAKILAENGNRSELNQFKKELGLNYQLKK